MAKAGDKQYVSRELAGRVRNLTLKEIEKVLLGEECDYKKQLVIRLAGTVLPRLNEVTGEDGSPIVIQVAKEGDIKYKLNDNSNESAGGDTV